MPYIEPCRRNDLLNDNLGLSMKGPGDLNFKLTSLLKQYIASNGLSYASINDVIGALEGAKLEFYRRISAPYEDSKIIANGDVY